MLVRVCLRCCWVQGQAVGGAERNLHVRIAGCSFKHGLCRCKYTDEVRQNMCSL